MSWNSSFDVNDVAELTKMRPAATVLLSVTIMKLLVVSKIWSMCQTVRKHVQIRIEPPCDFVTLYGFLFLFTTLSWPKHTVQVTSRLAQNPVIFCTRQIGKGLDGFCNKHPGSRTTGWQNAGPDSCGDSCGDFDERSQCCNLDSKQIGNKAAKKWKKNFQ